MRLGFYVLSALAAAGIFASQELVETHAKVKLGGGDTGLCGAFEGFSCADAAQSVYATIGSLPIASLGLAWYAVVLLLAGLIRFGGDKVKGAREVLFVGTLLSVLYSVFLAVVSLVDLGKLCPFCAVLYVVNIGLFVTAWRVLPEGPKAALKAAPGLLTKNATWITVAGMVVAVLVAQGMYARTHAEFAQRLAQHRADRPPPSHHDIDTSGTAGKGPADAPVVLVEYSDFECPYCKRLTDALHEVAEREPELLRIHFKHFPMDTSCNDTMAGPLHKEACNAAVAAVCAERQGKLWPMHDLLFANARKLSREAYLEFAAQIGVDVEGFRACLDDPAALQRVKDDIAEGAKMGVRGTPTFFVNGWFHEGARDPDKLQGIVRLAAEQAKKKAAKAAEAP
ncbi:MAG: thioredoxin domain-containing protein [Myxococcales bacterium]|nr:thioredoxin domain-containing protein [Myxococcales bacterium]